MDLNRQFIVDEHHLAVQAHKEAMSSWLNANNTPESQVFADARQLAVQTHKKLQETYKQFQEVLKFQCSIETLKH